VSQLDFQYRAKASNGEMLRGKRTAESEADVVAWIRAQGWMPIEVSTYFEINVKQRRKNVSYTGASFLRLTPRARLKDKLVFFRQLSTMISAGISITPSSMEVLIEQTSNKRFKRVLASIFDRVSSGVPLAGALAEHPKFFDTLSLVMVKTGEESGTLDVSLARLSLFLEEQENLRKKIISAVTYPAAVIMVALLALGVMIVVVVPQFQKAFGNLNVKMPKLTLMLFELGNWAKGHWLYIPIAVLAFAVLLHLLKKIEPINYQIDSALLKLPVFGGILYKAAIARSFRTMASLLKSGIPVLKALELAGDVAGNKKLRKGFLVMRDAVAMGVPMNVAMKEKKLFSPLVCHMVAVGEETGRTDEMLAKVADWYEAELSETIKRLSSILEPALVVFVGVIVGVMVLAIFLPILTAIQAYM